MRGKVGGKSRRKELAGKVGESVLISRNKHTPHEMLSHNLSLSCLNFLSRLALVSLAEERIEVVTALKNAFQ